MLAPRLQRGRAGNIAPRPSSHLLTADCRLIEVPPQLAAVGWVAQLAQRLGLDLPDALAGDAELAPDLLQRAEAAILQPEAELDDPALAVGQALERVADLALEELLRGQVERRGHRLVFDEVAEEGVAVLPDRGLQRHRVARHVEHLADLIVA